MSHQTNNLLTTQQAAERLHLAVQTLRSSRSTGVLCNRPAPQFIRRGRKVFYLADSLSEWEALDVPLRHANELELTL